jgi:hypothetical protein
MLDKAGYIARAYLRKLYIVIWKSGSQEPMGEPARISQGLEG